MIRVMDLPPDITRSSSSARPLMAPSEQSVRSEGLFKDTADAVERESIVTVLKRNRWNISTAVKELGISRSTIYRKMEKHNIVPPNLLN
jgi:transcriptional regulator of acetoin/glycerol metabolism